MSNLTLKPDNLFFVSDQHHNHANVIKFCNRPFKTIQEHDAKLIFNYNRTVPKDGEVIMVGDFCFGNGHNVNKIIDRLNGKKHIVWGNHDKASKQSKNRFNSNHDYLELKVLDPNFGKHAHNIMIFHYPIGSWNKMHYGSWCLSGHCHNNYLPTKWTNSDSGYQLDVGVDAVAAWLAEKNNTELLPEYYRPISFQEIKDHFDKIKKFKD